MSQPTSRGTCYCVAIRRCLKPGDRFHCSACEDDAPTDSDLPALLPPAESNNGGNEQTLVNMAHSQARPSYDPSIRELFAQVTGKAPATQRLAGNQVSFASAQDKVMVTFSSHRKVAEYQKLGRGPTPLAAANAARKVGYCGLLLDIVTLTLKIIHY